ncbi:MAG: sugar phosphate isomerase/epimerase [Clostridia bacterium]
MSGFGIFSWFSYQLPVQERLQLIKEAGFNATALWWGDEPDENKNSQPAIARSFGLDIDYVHAPANNPNDLWSDCISGEDYLESLIACVADCQRHRIPTAVAHITRLSSKPPITPIGLKRVKRLVDFAETKQVNIALENTNGIQHLDYIFSNIQSERLGFCYDSGHEYYNHPDADCLSRYSDKLLAVHLDDNFGDDDTHLLPFDGAIDWNQVMLDLSKCKKPRNITLEADFNRNHKKSLLYKDLSAADFLAMAYTKLLKLTAAL